MLGQADDREGRRTYRVLGLGYVEGFDGNHFVIRGEPINETTGPLAGGVIPAFQPFEFSPAPVAEALRMLREKRFTSVIRQLYHEKCSLCQVGYRFKGRAVGLEAAHVILVEDRGIVGDVRNGLLLCANHHALFDAFTWVFDQDYRVLVTRDRDFRDSALANHVLGWEGKGLPNLPSAEVNYPALEAVEWRLDQFQRRQ